MVPSFHLSEAQTPSVCPVLSFVGGRGRNAGILLLGWPHCLSVLALYPIKYCFFLGGEEAIRIGRGIGHIVTTGEGDRHSNDTLRFVCDCRLQRILNFTSVFVSRILVGTLTRVGVLKSMAVIGLCAL